MNNVFYEKLKETASWKEFVSKEVGKITENEYHELCGKCIDEVDEEKPDFSKMGFSGNMVWFSPRQKAFRELIEKLGIHVKWNSEFEDRLRDYIKEQGPNPGVGPIGKTEWYSQKRKELEDIMAREDNDVGC